MKPVFATQSTRDRMAAQDTSNIKMGRPVNGDFHGLKSADGYVTIIAKREGRTYTWIGQCTKPGCMCSGFTFTHEYLVNGGEVKCGSSGHDAVSATPTARRQFVAGPGDSFALRPGAQGSARSRMEAAQRAEEIDALEEGGQ
jgi:cell wall-associated NlpC family hydrolase